MWCHGTVAELLGEAGLCRCARMPDAAYVQVTDCYWRKADIGQKSSRPLSQPDRNAAQRDRA